VSIEDYVNVSITDLMLEV